MIVACAILLAGCTWSDRPATAPVRGQVTYRGRPVAGATITFLCPGAPRLALGTTDASGNYRLTTFEPNDGAIVGTHVVTVKKYSTEPEGEVAPANTGQDPRARERLIEETMQRTARQIEQAEREWSQLPAKYGDRKTSDLYLEVHEGDNIINIELAD